MFITREIINKDIKFHDIEIKRDNTKKVYEYTYDHLCVAIDRYKDLMIRSGVNPQQSAAIGEEASIWQIASIFACFELGVKVSITDYYTPGVLSRLKSKNLELDSKTKSLLPIDYVLQPFTDENSKNLKRIYNTKVANTVLIKSFDRKDLTESIEVPQYPYDLNSSFIATKSATSGTTGKRKCIEHSHEFYYELLQRNSKTLSGSFISTTNLNHGSSIFCYLIPSLVSKDITDIYSIIVRDSDNDYNYFSDSIIEFLKTISENENNLLLPYSRHIENFLSRTAEQGYNFPKTILHTVSYIPEIWKEKYYSTGIIGDVISNFGSNETAGPIFLNKISNNNFTEKTFSIVDNFYKVRALKSGLEVTMPVYNSIIIMNDLFTSNEENIFVYNGRINFIRINDIEVDMRMYSNIVEKNLWGQLVYDQVRAKIYLAIWGQNTNHGSYSGYMPRNTEQIIKSINHEMGEISLERHYICKYANLCYEDYLDGIKIDMEKLREYFRNPDENYKKLN